MKFSCFVLLAIFTFIIFGCEPRDPSQDNRITTDGCVERIKWPGDSSSYAYLKLKDDSTEYRIDMCCDNNALFWSPMLEGDLSVGTCYRISHEYRGRNSRIVRSAKIIQKPNPENINAPTPTIKQKDVRPQPLLNPEDIPEIKPNTKPLIIIIEDGNDKKIMKEFKDTLKKYEDNLESDRAKLEELNI